MRTRVSSKFNRCVKSVKRTVRARKGSNKESAAIAICTKSVLHKRGRTMKRYRRGRLITQKKFRGGLNIGLPGMNKPAAASTLQKAQQGFRDIQASRMADVKAAETALKNSDGTIDDMLQKDLTRAQERAGLLGSESTLARRRGY